ncbi:hypothetical protein ASPZODRAFT_156333 [Penicilliopsis zonata CBS 506.65]|uniref:AMP-activated protein kinase glycogen-binding domain-containing protein n=1 Tax=Penicilliopsis zonata CBS 506.65 TaxID=1073090 RepID=A0A1L9SWC8_9EURO|nr:hypothetical protein ASPZODRAFT_156333 [Penicilliopsis zonata CBS 506.65]OJJ51454.1 hypothetical protein ASPZODRAFT_156333 [Penicilliopsis zonata CBS 506.65]
MGTYVFRWPHAATEVFVTGTFDDWGKTVKLEKKGDVFEKEVALPAADQEVQYKFVVDGIWTTDSHAYEEDDGHNNINNVLFPKDIKKYTPQAAVMSGVAPGSTTAALAAAVPKESEKNITAAEDGAHTLSSVAPGSTTAELAKNVPLVQNEGLPGTFPETPAKEAETFSVNPLPATNGIGNPIRLTPGESVPAAGNITSNTVQSTVRTDKAAYEQDASAPFAAGAAPLASQTDENGSAFAVPPVSKNMIPESSLPIGGNTENMTDPGVTIQSAAPTSTTAVLAAAVPLESRRQAEGEAPVSEVPAVVKNSMAEAHEPAEAAASHEAVSEKKEVEQELLAKTGGAEGEAPVSEVPAVVKNSMVEAHVPAEAAASYEAVSEKKEVEQELLAKTGGAGGEAPVSAVPAVVQDSIAEAHRSPEAAANQEAVREKTATEEELRSKVSPSEAVGQPAPTATAVATETAPAPTAAGQQAESRQLSPRSTTPVPGGTTTGPTVTSGVASAPTSEVSTAVPGKKQQSTAEAGTGTSSKETKKKHRLSFFQKLKEKFK